MLVSNSSVVKLCLFLLGSGFATTAFAVQGDFRLRLHEAKAEQFENADIAAEMRFGREVAARILGKKTPVNNFALIEYINLVGNALALHSPRSELQFYFTVLDDDSINAYSAPGGYIFITQGAVLAAKDEAELAAVLAHEIAHISQRHIVRELNIHGVESSGLAGITRFLGASGDTARAAVSQVVDKAMMILFQSGYKIEDELEADHVATLLLAETGYDPLALQRYLHRLGDTKDTNHTHPASQKRFDSINELILEEGMSSRDFHTVEERFKSHVKP